MAAAEVQRIAWAHYRRRQELARFAAARARRFWLEVDRSNIAGSWQRILPRLVAVLSAAQLTAAEQSQEYVAGVLAAQGADEDFAGVLVPSRLAGVASDGRALDSLLYLPAIDTLTDIRDGASVGQAMQSGLGQLITIAATQIQDAGRVADGINTVGHRRATGYVRMLSAPSCSRCVVLAGKFYRSATAFDRHPKCFPAGVVVSGPQRLATTRRWYEGELVVLATASEQQLSVTGNHPVLTSRGWVPANLIQEGDYVVRSVLAEGARSLVIPGEDQVPALIEDGWRSGQVGSLLRMPTSAEDFHGDGGHGDVDVVLADGLLRDRFESELGEPGDHLRLAGGLDDRSAFDPDRSLQQVLVRLLRTADCGVSGGGLRLPRGGGHLGGPDETCGRVAADLYASVLQAGSDGASGDAVSTGDAVLALAGSVRGSDLVAGQHSLATRWDAPAVPFSVESRVAYADRGDDLRLRLAGQVELDRVVSLRRVQWSGHVYNLTSSEGWFSANGLIVSNCDCINVPAAESLEEIRTSPKRYFDSLSEADQDAAFTKAGARAIRDGADLAQVVNARRGAAGLAPAGGRLTAAEVRALRNGLERGRLTATRVLGQDVFVTTEGTTTRGAAGVRLGARESGVKRPGARYRSARPPRLMPESIYQLAGADRDEALRLLRRFGYIT